MRATTETTLTVSFINVEEQEAFFDILKNPELPKELKTYAEHFFKRARAAMEEI